MDSVFDSIDPQVVLGIGAIVVAFLLLRLLLRFLQVGFGSIVTILVILLILNYVFDINPKQLWFEISHLPQDLVRWTRSL